MAINKSEITELVTKISNQYSNIAKAVMILPNIKTPALQSEYAAYIMGKQGAPTSETELRTKILEADFKTYTAIDPFNAFDIFEKMFWPNMGSFVVGMKDDPKEPSNIAKSACNGVLYSEIFTNRAFTTKTNSFISSIKATRSGINWLDSGTNIQQDFRDIDKLWRKNAGELGTSDADCKEVLSILFSNESIVKLWIIFLIGGNSAYFQPFSILRVDPYLAYLSVFLAHIGSGDFGSYPGVKEAFASAGPSSGSWPEYVGTDTTKRANLAKAATKVLEAIAAWLAKTKADAASQDLYNYWNSLFITDKKCLINMLVIMNEVVNLKGQTNTYTYQPDAGNFQDALGLAYKNFTITIAE